jgi:hypothetical protein
MNMNNFELQDLNFHLCHATSLSLNFESLFASLTVLILADLQLQTQNQ